MTEAGKVHSHLEVRKVNVEKPRRKVGAGRPPSRNNVEHGAQLIEKVKELRVDFQEKIRIKSTAFDPEMIFSIKLDGHVDENDFSRSGLVLLGEEPENKVVLFSPDQLGEFSKRLGLYGKEVAGERKGPHYGWIASLTKEIQLWGREQRIGRKLSRIDWAKEQSLILDVELWSYGSLEDQRNRLEELRNFVQNNGGALLDDYVTPYISIARVKSTGDLLNQLLEIGTVQTIDLPPQPGPRLEDIFSLSIQELPGLLPPEEGSPGVCVLDTGIIAGHPLLAPAVGDVRAIPSRFGDGADDHGHGTRIAGLIIYGDLRNIVADGVPRPEAYVYSIKVTNKQNRFDDERLIVNQMHEAITKINDEYGCRVFNISLGDPEQVYREGKPSPWAYILDVLARERDIVIVVSTGNYDAPTSVRGEKANQFRTSYPNYLLHDEARIIEPATAANVITVGSLNGYDESYFVAGNPNDPGYRILGPSSFPSPFSRTGPGMNGAIKPEVVDIGGSYIWSRYADGFANDRNLQVVSTNHDLLQGLFTSDIGTSYSAAKVTNLASRILKAYPGISANLVRALIATASSIPADLLGAISVKEALSLVGYGKPDLVRALYSSESRVTMFAEDDIGIDNLHLYSIPVPDEFKATGGKRQVSISLAFDPPVRHTRLDYLGFTMEFHLFRGLTPQRIVDYFSQRPKDFKPDDIPQRYHCTTYPGVRVRGKGTLQKGIFNISRDSALLDYQGSELQLLIKCKSGWATEADYPRQKYAIAVTLEQLSQQIPIYQQVRQQLQQEVRARSRA